MNLFHVGFAQTAPNWADLECTDRGSSDGPAFLTCGLKSALQGVYPHSSLIFQRNLQNWCHFGAACLGFMCCIVPGCRLSSGPSGNLPCSISSSTCRKSSNWCFFPWCFFLYHTQAKNKQIPFLSPHILLPSPSWADASLIQRCLLRTWFLDVTFLLFIPVGLGSRLMFPGKGSPVYDWRIQCLNNGYQGWREPTLVWDSVTQWGQLGARVRLREWQASLLLTPLGGKHNLKSRR